MTQKKIICRYDGTYGTRQNSRKGVREGVGYEDALASTDYCFDWLFLVAVHAGGPHEDEPEVGVCPEVVGQGPVVPLPNKQNVSVSFIKIFSTRK